MEHETGCWVESLEQRCLLSASLVNGVLTIEGTRRADVIRIAPTFVGAGRAGINVAINGQFFYVFRMKQVQQLRVICGLGDDYVSLDHSAQRVIPNGNPLTGGDSTVYLNPLSIPASIAGGGGNDSIIGGWGDDALSGDAGNDSIDGNDGRDTLVGGEGDDTLAGGSGDDTVNGGNGNDDVSGDRAIIDRMPFAYLNGPDSRNIRYGKDVVIGGAGRDSFHNSDDLSEYRDATGRDEWVVDGIVY